MKCFKYVNNDTTYLVSISYVLSKIWGKDFQVKQEMYFGPISVIKNENGKNYIKVLQNKKATKNISFCPIST